ncbi:MAG: hypothetical protein AAFU85_03750, partial [Planctomycetota bacterium]
DNVIECEGLARPLFRNDASYGARVENNRLVNVRDSDRLKNPQSTSVPGLEAPLRFQCGVHGEWLVDGWNATRP